MADTHTPSMPDVRGLLPPPGEPDHRIDRIIIGACPGAVPARVRIAFLDRAPRTELGAAAIVGGPL